MSDSDEFDISSLLGMSSILNRDETSNGVNVKSVEKEFIKKHQYEDDSGDEEYDDDTMNYNPISEYNSILNDIDNLSDNNDDNNSGKIDVDDIESIISDSYKQQTQPPQPVKNFYEDKFAYKLTEEQNNQKIVDSVLHFPKQSGDEYNYNLYDENREDMKLTLLEKIDNLKEELEDDGINTDKIPKVDFSTNLEQIEYAAKLLMLKVNRNRYSNMGEEFILAMANGLEILCDGKREFFGLKPDLTNCTDIVKVKLRRVKNETSQIVSNVVEKYEISPIMTVLIELMPSLFLHSRRRSLQTSNNIFTDVSDDINEIRKY